jgi:hypothetical protein
MYLFLVFFDLACLVYTCNPSYWRGRSKRLNYKVSLDKGRGITLQKQHINKRAGYMALSPVLQKQKETTKENQKR